MKGWGPSIPVLLNPRLNQLYAFGYDGFYVIDCSTDAIVYTNNYVGVLSAALDSTDNKLYCPSYDELAVFDCSAQTVVATIPLPYSINFHAVWSPAHNKVYVSYGSDQSAITVIDCRTDTVLKHIPIAGGAGDMCVHGSDKVYFCADTMLGVIDVATDSIMGHTHLPVGPTWLALNPVTDRLVIQDWWNGTFIYDCVGDTLVDSLPYNVAGFGGIDVRKNTLYLRLLGAVCAIDMETGLVLDTLLARSVDLMVLDTTDNKAYLIMENYTGGGNDTIFIVDTDSCNLLGVLRTNHCANYAALWNTQVNKLYVGEYSRVPVLEEPSGAEVRARHGNPTILPMGSGLGRLEACTVYDAMGRRAVSTKPGVYFVRDEGREAGGVGRPRKVVVTR